MMLYVACDCLLESHLILPFVTQGMLTNTERFGKYGIVRETDFER